MWKTAFKNFEADHITSKSVFDKFHLDHFVQTNDFLIFFFFRYVPIDSYSYR